MTLFCDESSMLGIVAALLLAPDSCWRANVLQLSYGKNKIKLTRIPDASAINNRPGNRKLTGKGSIAQRGNSKE